MDEIKAVYNVLASLEGGAILEEPAGLVKKPTVPLKDIVTAKYVVCLECGKKMRTLKAHIRKTHGLMPKEYFQRFGLDPKKFPLVCKEYSEQRSKMAKDRGFGSEGNSSEGELSKRSNILPLNQTEKSKNRRRKISPLLAIWSCRRRRRVNLIVCGSILPSFRKAGCDIFMRASRMF